MNITELAKKHGYYHTNVPNATEISLVNKSHQAFIDGYNACLKNNRIVNAYKKAIEISEKRGWNKVYIGVDIHDSVLESTYSTQLSSVFYPYAFETLRIWSKMENIVLILWTCSLEELCEKYHTFFKEHDIHFDHINENPSCQSTEYANFEKKLYFSLGIDDKFGFDPHEDWKALHDYLTTT